MLCLSGFELYSRWVPLIRAFTFLIYLTRLTGLPRHCLGQTICVSQGPCCSRDFQELNHRRKQTTLKKRSTRITCIHKKL